MENRNEEELLIRAVKKHPILYDKSMTKYKDPKVREREWLKVCEECDTEDIEYIKKRWRRLRDAFIKHYKTDQKMTKNGKKKNKWTHYDVMLFLVPHIEYRDLGSNQDIDDTNLENFESVDVDENKDIFEDAHSGQSDFTLKSGLKRQYDADECFLLSCVPSLKRLSPQNNMLARIQIQNLLFKLEFGENSGGYYGLNTEVIIKEDNDL